MNSLENQTCLIAINFSLEDSLKKNNLNNKKYLLIKILVSNSNEKLKLPVNLLFINFSVEIPISY